MGPLADDVVAVVREALANAAKHSCATSVSVDVSTTDLAVNVRIEDDGAGFEPAARTMRAGGTANMAARAAKQGGAIEFLQREGGGTIVAWSAPLPSAARSVAAQ